MNKGIQKEFKFKFFKGCLPQILLGQFLNTLTQISHEPFTKSVEPFFTDKRINNDKIILAEEGETIFNNKNVS